MAFNPVRDQYAVLECFSLICPAGSVNLVSGGQPAQNLDINEFNFIAGPMVFSPDGSRLALDIDASTLLWDAGGSLLSTLPGGQPTFNAAGSGLATVARGVVYQWTGQGLSTTAPISDNHGLGAVALGFDSDNLRLIQFDSDHARLTLWNVRTSAVVTLETQLDFASHPVAGFSADGKLLFSVGCLAQFGSECDRRLAHIWNADGLPLATLTGHTGAILAMTFSPDNKLVATGSADSSARLWDARGTLLATLAGHTDAVNAVRFSADGQLVVTGASDGQARLWRSDGTFLYALSGYQAPVTWAEFNWDGSQVAAGSQDDGLKLWPVYPDVPAMLAEAARRLGRRLTAAECVQYLQLASCP